MLEEKEIELSGNIKKESEHIIMSNDFGKDKRKKENH